VTPYDLVIFDEAHKLAADREPDFRIRKTDRYRLGEALAGAAEDDARWQLAWQAHHLILLRKVGGGYIFVHRMLLEYFASREEEKA
jgi:hypothetical protein